ncbi:MAG: hypothetical protein HFH33_06075 [Eubacterium sp.]|jgi:hypothetical protein|nr:hypothetical protein [Eubacterium sp.]
MQVIISANEQILAMAANIKRVVSEDMDEETYWNWIGAVGKDKNENADRVQEIPV